MHHKSVLVVQNCVLRYFFCSVHEVKKSQARVISQLTEILGERDQDGGGRGNGPQRIQPAIHFSLKTDHQQLEEALLAWYSVVPHDLLLHLSERKHANAQHIVLVKNMNHC